MHLRPLKPTNKRARIEPGLVFSFPCGDGRAVGVVAHKSNVFPAAFFDRLLLSGQDVEEFLQTGCSFAAFLTTDALIYHGEWALHGYLDVGDVPLSKDSSKSLRDVVPTLRSTQGVGTTSFSPKVVEDLVILHFTGAWPPLLKGASMEDGRRMLAGCLLA